MKTSSTKLQLYSIMPLDMEHIDEICRDVVEQYRDGVATCALFKMTLTPEGDPVVDKVGPLCEAYRAFQARLAPLGVPSGVLVQATIGHGYTLGADFPFQHVEGLLDGTRPFTACPADEGFQAYIREAMRTVAACRPMHIMIDDDFRLLARPGRGCFCALHRTMLAEQLSYTPTREQLLAASEAPTGSEGAALWDVFVDTQRRALLASARAMREGMDAIDPTLPASFCCCGSNAEFADEIARILAGEGNPVTVRINNGYYSAEGTKRFSSVFQRAAAQIEKLRGRVDVFLAETDTCPQNRYSTSALSLHSHFTGSLLEGCAGAKHWITRLAAYEPESGRAYRRILAKHRGFYEALVDLVPSLSWRGCRLHVSPVARHDGGYMGPDSFAWGACVLERMGLPFYTSSVAGGVLATEGDGVLYMTDEQILDALRGPVMLASDAAEHLIRRGFGAYLGIDVRPWDGPNVTGERLPNEASRCGKQMKVRELVVRDSRVRVDSVAVNAVGGRSTDVFAAVTVFANDLGGTAMVFCGTPMARHIYTEAYSFLNQSRKRQLVRLMRSVGELPVYLDSDDEVYLRAADTADGALFVALTATGFDPIEELSLVTPERTAQRVRTLTPEGVWVDVPFTVDGPRLHVGLTVHAMTPCMLLIN